MQVTSFADSADWGGFNTGEKRQVAALRAPAGFVLDLRAASGSGFVARGAAGRG